MKLGGGMSLRPRSGMPCFLCILPRKPLLAVGLEHPEELVNLDKASEGHQRSSSSFQLANWKGGCSFGGRASREGGATGWGGV